MRRPAVSPCVAPCTPGDEAGGKGSAWEIQRRLQGESLGYGGGVGCECSLEPAWYKCLCIVYRVTGQQRLGGDKRVSFFHMCRHVQVAAGAGVQTAGVSSPHAGGRNVEPDRHRPINTLPAFRLRGMVDSSCSSPTPKRLCYQFDWLYLPALASRSSCETRVESGESAGKVRARSLSALRPTDSLSSSDTRLLHHHS